MAKVNWSAGIDSVSGALAKPSKSGQHSCEKMLLGTHRVAATTSSDCNRVYIRRKVERSTSPGANELRARARFGAVAAAVKVSFAQSEGILAAFIGNDCCGVTTSENYNEGRYNLYISPSAQGEDVQLKFYSPDLKRIFVAKRTFKYINNDRLGSPDSPYTPEWTVAK